MRVPLLVTLLPILFSFACDSAPNTPIKKQPATEPLPPPKFAADDVLSTPRVQLGPARGCDFTREACEQQCDAGDPVSCYRLGRLLGHDLMGPADPARATSLFERACAAGFGDGCNALAVALRDEQHDSLRAVTLFEKACVMGSAKACNSAGSLRANTPATKDIDRARELFSRGCALPQPMAPRVCISLGDLLRGLEDFIGARAAFATACNAGNMDGCKKQTEVQPGVPVRSPSSEVQQNADAVACSTGEPDSCTRVAARMRQATPADTAGAIKLLTSACQLGGATACADLVDSVDDPVLATKAARIGCDEATARKFHDGKRVCQQYAERLATGRGVAKDVRSAVTLAIATCEAAPPYGCLLGGTALLTGDGVDANADRGISLLMGGCGKGEEAACSLLKDRGVDPKKAKGPSPAERAREGCDAGKLPDCVRLGQLLVRGSEGVAADPVQAKALFDRACAQKVRSGCSAISQWRGAIKATPDEVEEASRRACDLGDTALCRPH